MTVIENPLLLRKKAVSGDNLGKSLRFNSVDSTYLHKTPSNAGNRKTWTWAGWVKRSNLGSLQMLFTSHVSGNDYVQLFFNTDDTLRFDNNNSWKLFSNAVYRDVSAWMHVVCAVNTTLSTADDRIKLFVNGRQLTTFGTRANPSQNDEGAINTTLQHSIGSEHPAYTRHFDGYLADVHFIDGLALSPAAFGEFDSSGSGVWNPKAFALPAPNDGTTWSDKGSGTLEDANSAWTNLFDGNAATSGGAVPASGSTLTWEPDTAITCSEFAVWCQVEGTGASFKVNDIEYFPEMKTALGNQTWGWYTFSGLTSLSKVTWNQASGTKTQPTAFSCDGVMLVDDQTDQTFAQWQAATSDDVNSFHLKFADVSSDAALGIDSFGNGTWTVSGLSVSTASDGINLDAFVDHPSTSGTDTGVGGEVRSNYATWNPLVISSSGAGGYKQGNLKFEGANAWKSTTGTMAVSSGKWYYEAQIVGNTYGTAGGNVAFVIGYCQVNTPLTDEDLYNQNTQANRTVGIHNTGGYNNFGTYQGTVCTPSNGDTIGVALDKDSNNIKFFLNNSQVLNLTLGDTTSDLVPYTQAYYADSFQMNFGQRAFKYTAPSGYKALCSTNLPDTFSGDSVNNPSKYFDAKLYTGNGGTFSLTGLGFSPDFVWLKKMTSGNHVWWDQVRGVQKRLIQNGTSPGLGVAGETTETDGITHFTSDGWTTGANSSNNDDNAQYCSFNWDLGTGAATASTSGSINPSVQWKNTAAGFSVSKYNGTGSSATIGHGLGRKPDVILCKNLERSDGYWFLYHSSLGATKLLEFNSNPGSQTSSQWWDDTEPTSDVFTVNVKADNNASGDDHVAYCWAAIPGYSAFGIYTGNGSGDGFFVNCGFKPAFVYIKGTHASDGVVLDNARSTYNVNNQSFHNRQPDGSATDIPIDFLSNGFKNRSSHSSHNSSQDFVYWAFAEHPLKTARAR